MREAECNNGNVKRVHFAAVNSGYGFLSFYGEIFGDDMIKRRYIIKGGPGTGKSSFMKKIAGAAESAGRTVEYYRCSSDPDSLDGIIIDGEVAMLDGTAPHVYEPALAGVTDEIINLGEFWDSDSLYLRYNEIAALSVLKSNAYDRAYKFLGAALNVENINRSLVSCALLREKMNAAVSRILRNLPSGDGFEESYGFVNAIGMKGRAHLDTYEREAKKLYVIYDSYGFGGDLLLSVIEEARKRCMKIKVSYSPLAPDLPDAVLLKDSGTAFVLADNTEHEGDVKINMKRFVDSDAVEGVKSDYRINRRLSEALLASAVEALREAGRYHFELEQIYVSCMDFDAENKFIQLFLQKNL